MKKLLSLGGNYYQSTMVREARRMGLYIIGADNNPLNCAHQLENKYYNISTIDKEKILAIAQKEQIDGIISYASDVGALTAAYVAEKMGLPTNPLRTIELMTRKDLFHPFFFFFLFNAPETTYVESPDGIKEFIRTHGTSIVKPVNSSGSKGITIISNESQAAEAFNKAISFDKDGQVIAEEYFEKSGYQISGDIFVVDGKVRNWGFANAHRDQECNPLVPIGDSFPIYLDSLHLDIAKHEIQHALTELGFKNGPVNVEFFFDSSDRPIIVELGPRSGGGLLPDIIYMTSGIDIIQYCIKNSLGMSIDDIIDKPMTRNISAYCFHSRKDGIFANLDIKDKLWAKILQIEYFVQAGERVYRCDDSSKAIAIAICEFESQDEMLDMMDNMNEYYEVIYDGT